MKTMRLERFSSGFQSRWRSPSRDHVDALEDIALRLVGEGEDALGAQDVRAVALNDLVDPGQEKVGIDRAVELERHRAHFLVMQDFRRVMMFVMVMAVMVMVVIVSWSQSGPQAWSSWRP